MPRSATLTLVVACERLEDRSVDQPLPQDSILAAIAGRGNLERRWHADTSAQARLQPWQRGLLEALELDESAYPSAAISALGAGILSIKAETSDWLHAEPIHLAAGMNEVTLVRLGAAAALTRAERDALTTAMQDHLRSDGFELYPTASNEWLIGASRALNVQTVSAEYAMRNEWSAVLPQGEGAGQARRLMTELQMLLHDHPINEVRTARGVPTVNAVWLWGTGVAPSVSNATQPRACHGDNDYLRGICQANGWNTPARDLSVDAVIAQAQNEAGLVYVVTDPAEWDTRWLSPSIAALKKGAISRLELVIDEFHLTIDRWQLRKFWRAALPMASWVRA